MEGDNSQVEMKLSTEDEEVGGNGVGEHLNHTSTRQPSLTWRLGRTPKNLCFLAATGLLVFITGECGWTSWNLPVTPGSDPCPASFPSRSQAA